MSKISILNYAAEQLLTNNLSQGEVEEMFMELKQAGEDIPPDLQILLDLKNDII